MITQTILRMRAARGLAWMKKNGAQYDLDVRRVNLDDLDARDNHLCILGQAYAGPVDAWETGFDVIADLISDGDLHAGDVWLLDHGFDLKHQTNDTSGVWERLQAAWVEILKEDAAAT